MRTRDVKDVAASIHRRLQNLPDLQQDFQYTLIRYAAERLLYRLSQSPHRDRFVLKGAMLFVIWIGHVPRPTKDVDLLGRSDLGIAELEEIFRGVCSIPCPEDGLAFDVASVRAQEIREEQEYGGIRVTAGATLGRAKIPIQVDVGFGDAIVPEATETEFPTLLDLAPPKLRVYPRETVVAEKLEAIVKLGIATSRMKDIYDLHVLAKRFTFPGLTLARAIRATFERRKTELPRSLSDVLGDSFLRDAGKRAQWAAFLRRMGAEPEGPTLDEAVRIIQTFVGLPVQALAAGLAFDGTWSPSGPWQTNAGVG
jgi:predicted nucleotidyltransferase component of viral defense system